MKSLTTKESFERQILSQDNNPDKHGEKPIIDESYFDEKEILVNGKKESHAPNRNYHCGLSKEIGDRLLWAFLRTESEEYDASFTLIDLCERCFDLYEVDEHYNKDDDSFIPKLKLKENGE